MLLSARGHDLNSWNEQMHFVGAVEVLLNKCNLEGSLRASHGQY